MTASSPFRFELPIVHPARRQLVASQRVQAPESWTYDDQQLAASVRETAVRGVVFANAIGAAARFIYACKGAHGCEALDLVLAHLRQADTLDEAVAVLRHVGTPEPVDALALVAALSSDIVDGIAQDPVSAVSLAFAEARAGRQMRLDALDLLTGKTEVPTYLPEEWTA